MIITASTAFIVLAHAGEHPGGGIELPPLHPILVNFTAALVPVSLGADLLGRVLKRETLRHAGWWTMFFAAVVTPLTVLAGWLWLRDMADMEGMKEMSIHKWLGTSMAIVLPLFAWWRWYFHRKSLTPGWSYLLVLALVTGGLTLQGHLGGMMSFGNSSEASGGSHAPKPGRPASGPTSQPAMPGGHHHGAGAEANAEGHDLGGGWKDEIQVK